MQLSEKYRYKYFEMWYNDDNANKGDVQMKTTMGEKIKDMRVERHMTTKQLAQETDLRRVV